MKRSFIRWGTTLGLCGGVLLGSLMTNVAQVFALTNEQVMERLRPVPVFTITDSQGAPLVATPTEGESRDPVAGVFINRQDAQAFLDNLKQNNPQVAQGVQIVPVSLAQVYEMAQQNQDQEQQLRFAFIPAQQQVDAAKTVLQQSGQNADQFQGVPLFIARAGSEAGSYLTIRQGEEEVIPMFFSRNELQTLLDRLRETQPDLANGVSVQVVNLEGLIQTLQTSNNDELTRILLVPPRESVDFIRSLQGNQNQGGQNQNRRQSQNQSPRNQAQPANQQPAQQRQ